MSGRIVDTDPVPDDLEPADADAPDDIPADDPEPTEDEA